MIDKSLGQIYYEEMMNFTGGTSRETGFRLLEWQDLHPEDRRMHDFGGQAILAAVIAWPKCRNCGGGGTILSSRVIDPASDQLLNWHDVECAECHGLGRVNHAAK